MRIEVTLTPPRHTVDGITLRDLQVGRVYELPDLIGQVLWRPTRLKRRRSRRARGSSRSPEPPDRHLGYDSGRLAMTSSEDRFPHWIAALEGRHLADLTFAEVSRALRALSSAYVERRHRLTDGAALEGTGKRAAFALFYGPLHFLLVRQIARALDAARDDTRLIVDVGCGTGAAGSAWALASGSRPRIVGVDRHPWAVAEAAWTYRSFGLEGHTRRGDALSAIPRERADVVAAFTVNELSDDARAQLLARLLDAAKRGGRVLIVEPLAKSAVRWWPEWRQAIRDAGGREDEWRFGVELPTIVAKLDRAAGLDHRELTGRSLWLSRSERI